MEKKGQRGQGQLLYFTATSDKRWGQSSVLCWAARTYFSDGLATLQNVENILFLYWKALPASSLKMQ